MDVKIDEEGVGKVREGGGNGDGGGNGGARGRHEDAVMVHEVYEEGVGAVPEGGWMCGSGGRVGGRFGVESGGNGRPGDGVTMYAPSCWRACRVQSNHKVVGTWTLKSTWAWRSTSRFSQVVHEGVVVVQVDVVMVQDDVVMVQEGVVTV